jgi:hypothetical protein
MALSVVPWVLLRVVFLRTVADLVLAVLAFPALLSVAAFVGFNRERRRVDDEDY